MSLSHPPFSSVVTSSRFLWWSLWDHDNTMKRVIADEPHQYITSYKVAFLSPEPVTMYLSSVEMSQLSTEDDSLLFKSKAKDFYELTNESISHFKPTWNMLTPIGVFHALRMLSFPVLMNHLPDEANFNANTQLSCKWSWYLSALVWCKTST